MILRAKSFSFITILWKTINLFSFLFSCGLVFCGDVLSSSTEFCFKWKRDGFCHTAHARTYCTRTCNHCQLGTARHSSFCWFNFDFHYDGYCIYSNERGDAYLIFRSTSEALIRGRRLFKNCTRRIYFSAIFLFNGTLSIC